MLSDEDEDDFEEEELLFDFVKDRFAEDEDFAVLEDDEDAFLAAAFSAAAFASAASFAASSSAFFCASSRAAMASSDAFRAASFSLTACALSEASCSDFCWSSCFDWCRDSRASVFLSWMVAR